MSRRSVSRDPTYRWLIKRKSGGTISAIDLQRIYLEASIKRLKGVDEQTDWVLGEWEATLDALERDPMTLADRLDWVAKKKMYQEYIDSEGVGWHDEIMQSLDLEYHNVNPSQSLFYALEESGEMIKLIDHAEIAQATVASPSNTRAAARASIINRLIAAKSRDYVIDWDIVYLAKNRQLDLKNPFDTYAREAESFGKTIG